MTYDFAYASLGAGVQSTALVVLSTLGLHGCPRADCAIFADTQDEPAWVYRRFPVGITCGEAGTRARAPLT